jgi:predicted NBD/HSP70 family sugar kinase
MVADTPVRQASLREHNLALVLRQVATSPQPISRAGIAGITGLTRATISALVEDLIAGKLVSEVEPARRAGAGRPANGLRLAANGPAGLGLEVNVDYLAACVVDLTGEVRHHRVHRADQRPRPPEQVLAALAELATEATGAASAQGLTVAGAALAVPGLVTDRGKVRLAPNLGWRDVDVPEILAGAPVPDGMPAVDGFPAVGSFPAFGGIPVSVDNEANLAALGELHASHTASFIYVSGEIGIGAGIVLDGRLFRGARGFSGELGHVTIHPAGLACRCGARGCLEQYAGQETILRAAGLSGLSGTDGQTLAGRIAELAGEGHPGMLAALEEAGTALGVAAAGVINLLDIDTIVLGGIYAPAASWLRAQIEREVSERVLTAGWAPVTVRPAALGSEAAVLGAAGSVVRAIRDAPARWLTTAARV